ncbi:MAG: cytochrome c-type biosis protein CcmF [Sphingomonadales bacterium]|jgi:cytochrome c-type biogenesis protein CcmF|nr:cytochrome c-type biosis protein CcmF [Sphingomonadales bacterium]MEA3048298.1 cytochrome c-type biosis protein CcmF [Sphingomonadales bacterium]
MIAEAGLAALWIAAALSLLQLFFGAMALTGTPILPVSEAHGEGDRPKGGGGANSAVGPSTAFGGPPPHGFDAGRTSSSYARAVRPVAVAQAVLAGLSFLILIQLFLRTDLSVELVASNSHSLKPWLYKFAGAWGNHEGSMLLWVTVLALAGAAVALFERSLEERTLLATLAAQAAIGLGFYAFLLFASNPFRRLFPVPVEGNGLNPLLQDPGLAFHPPTLYFGYVGVSIAFSFAVGALVTRNVGPAFARAMRPWVLTAWIFLTLGITAGSYWAYYELGWGGWWFWDPVENASLMPWLATTALLHSATVLATRDSLRAWTVMLAVVAFSMSMVGTFLVRSGILTSVHAFAIDPRRGAFILALLALYIGGALTLFAVRVGTVKEGSTFEPVSREGALVLNNLLLTVILGLVLIGTLYPLATEAMGVKVSVGAPYFNLVTGPLALLLVVAMAAGPLMRWRRDRLRAVAGRIALPILLTALALLALVLLAPGLPIFPFLGLMLALGVGAASLAPLWKRNLRRTPLFTYGMVISHLGIAVSLAGMASNAAFTRETLVAARPGESVRVGPYSLRFAGVEPVAGPNWTAVEATLVASRGGGSFVLKPEARAFSAPPTETSEAAIATRLDGQLYTVIGKPDAEGRWQLRLWWKPFVTLIWAGGAMVAIGGFLALVGRVRRERRTRLRHEEAKA